METQHPPRPFRALVTACAERDISRTVAFELARKGLIENFLIGKRRYCYVDSLDTLPARLAAAEAVEVS